MARLKILISGQESSLDREGFTVMKTSSATAKHYVNAYGIKAALAGTPFIVSNGSQFEVHDYEFDSDGRRWEITVAGPFDSDIDKDILDAVREFRVEAA